MQAVQRADHDIVHGLLRPVAVYMESIGTYSLAWKGVYKKSEGMARVSTTGKITSCSI